MKSMLEKDIKENLDLIPKILETLLDRGHVEEVFDRLELMFGKGCAPDLNKLSNVLCEKGKSFTACQLLQFALQKNCNIKAATYDTVLNGLCTDGKANQAFYLLFRITKKGSRFPTLTCYETLISSLQAEGKTEQAELISSRFMSKSSKDKEV
jgi:pentatricopeptide repeat protein